MKTSPSNTHDHSPFAISERLRIAPLVLSLLLAGLAPSGHAAPPEFMSYQGFVADANGNPLAPSTPANYPVIFRIYTAATGGTRLWSEQQIVTVDKGNFSVLLGEGTPIGGEARPALSTVFSGPNNADRYVSLSVTIGGTTSEMLPRLRWLPSPYAFTATSASSLVQPNGNPVLSYANNRLEVTGEFFASGNLNLGGTLGVPALNVNGNATVNYLTVNAQVAGGLEGGEILLRGTGVPSTPDWYIDNFGGSVRFHSAGGTKFSVDGTGKATTFGSAIVNGNVGIGTGTPADRLQIGDFATASSYLSIKTGGGNLWQSGVKFRHFDDSIGFDIVDSEASPNGLNFIRYPAAPGVSAMYIDRFSGNVGIGTTTPGAKLTVNGDMSASGSVTVGGASTLELGAGVAGKELNAGKIGYQAFTTGHLDIVGAGTNGSDRKVKVWAEGGTDFAGPIKIKGEKPFAFRAFTGTGPALIDTGWATNRYVASIAGFRAANGDVDEGNNLGNFIVVRAIARPGFTTWFIEANYRSHSSPEEVWTVTAMRVVRELVTDDSTF